MDPFKKRKIQYSCPALNTDDSTDDSDTDKTEENSTNHELADEYGDSEIGKLFRDAGPAMYPPFSATKFEQISTDELQNVVALKDSQPELKLAITDILINRKTRIKLKRPIEIDFSSLDFPKFPTTDLTIPESKPCGIGMSSTRNHSAQNTDNVTPQDNYSDDENQDSSDIIMVELFGLVGVGDLLLRPDEIRLLCRFYIRTGHPSSYFNFRNYCGGHFFLHLTRANYQINHLIISFTQEELDRDDSGFVRSLQRSIMDANAKPQILIDPRDNIPHEGNEELCSPDFALNKYRKLIACLIKVEPLVVRDLTQLLTCDPDSCFAHKDMRAVGAIQVITFTNLQKHLDEYMVCSEGNRETKCKHERCQHYTIGRNIVNNPCILVFYSRIQHSDRTEIETFPIILKLNTPTRSVTYYLHMLTLLKDNHYQNLIIGQENGELFVYTTSNSKISKDPLKHSELEVVGTVIAVYSLSPESEFDL